MDTSGCFAGGLPDDSTRILNIKGILSFSKADKTTTSTNEIYDDEVAYHYVEKILGKLKEEGFKIVFILDELDKVEDNEITKLINEMKPYLLSGLADFIVVAGQSLTYKYLSSSTVDDAVISSLFSKTFHVQLKSVAELRDIMKHTVLKFDSSLDSSLLDRFISHQIFTSRRIPRILFSQIRQTVSWKEGKAYIDIQDNDALKLSHIIIEKIEEIVRTSIEPLGYRPVVKDYLIVQLYMVAASLESKKGKEVKFDLLRQSFEKSDLFYHAYYYSILDPCLIKLINSLEEPLGLKISSKVMIADVNEEISASDIAIAGNIEANESKVARSLEVFKNDLNELGWLLRVTNLAVNEGDNTNYNSLQLLEKFSKNGFLKMELPKDALFQSFMTSSTILDDQDNLKKAYKIVQDEKFDHAAVGYSIVRHYVRNQLASVFSNFDIRENMASDALNDFIIENPNSRYPNVFVEFKLLRNGILDLDVSRVVRSLVRYNSEQEKGNYYVVIVLTSQPKDSFDSEIFKFHADVRDVLASSKLDSGLAGRISLVMRQMSAMKLIGNDLTRIKEGLTNYKVRYEYDRNRPVKVPDDIQKGRWGEKSENNGRKVTAVVGNSNDDFYLIKLVVTSTDNTKPLEGEVVFYLHDTFTPIARTVPVVNNNATLDVEAYEAFTVGVVADFGETTLELDLNEVKAPKDFKYKK